jgi:hypothetical protein
MKTNLVVLGLSVFMIFLGLAIIRVGLVGKYLDHLRLVSYVKKSSDEPRWYHRCITTGMGALFVLLGTGLFVFLVLSLSRLK